MALIEHTLFGITDKVNEAKKVLTKYKPTYLAFSGGKDSQTCYHLMREAGLNFRSVFRRACEPPEVIYFIRNYYPNVEFEIPEKSIYTLIEENGIPPLRTIKYCCRLIKEDGGSGITKVTGIRWAESTRRKNTRNMVEINENGGIIINPIIAWSDDDVWQYIKERSIQTCSLYAEGRKRIGCVMCPNGNPTNDALRWPKIAKAYRHACRRAYDRRMHPNFANGDELYEWWVSGRAAAELEDDMLWDENDV